jgi:CRISPR/Cas system-associated endonuclease Cas1
MSYHIVSIDSPQCSLSCRDGQLTCKTAEGERRLPLEDVASIIITSFSASIHSELLLPANRSTDTLLSRALLNLSPRLRGFLWQRTVDAKCLNQAALAEHVALGDRALPGLRESALSKKPHKEAICVKAYWQILGRVLHQPEFSRDRAKPGFNSLLNYGYAVLHSTVLQKLFGVGLDPPLASPTPRANAARRWLTI